MGCSSAYITLFIVLFTFLADVVAVPITPSAADAERIVERMRAEGLSEVRYPFLYFESLICRK
jgi:hypothetical protein